MYFPAKHLVCSFLVIAAFTFHATAQDASATISSLTGLPTAPAHVVIVVEENHGYSQIIGSSQAPYINTLASEGALFTNSFAITHPSQPNYLALFSGSTQGITTDSCPHTFTAGTLESELLASGNRFAGYSEGLPSTGSEICSYGLYARKHAPWTDFSKDPSQYNEPFTYFPTTAFAKLPRVAWVVPNLDDDMHDGTVQQADAWLQHHLMAYATWARTNNSLLIVTFDEDAGTTGNHIATIFYGPMVKPGRYSQKITHYNVLRTIEDMYGLGHLGNTANVTPITGVWQ